MYAKPKNTIKMIVEWNRCIRVLPGDEQYMRVGVPHKCYDCAKYGDYNGKLVFPGDEVPYCTEHRRSYRPIRPKLAGSHKEPKRGTIETAPARAA